MLSIGKKSSLNCCKYDESAGGLSKDRSFSCTKERRNVFNCKTYKLSISSVHTYVPGRYDSRHLHLASSLLRMTDALWAATTVQPALLSPISSGMSALHSLLLKIDASIVSSALRPT